MATDVFSESFTSAPRTVPRTANAIVRRWSNAVSILPRGAATVPSMWRSFPFVAQIDPLDVRTHAFEDDEKAGSSRVYADILYQQLAILGEHSGRYHECGGRDVSWDGKLEGRYGGWAVGRFENNRAIPFVYAESK